MHGKFHGKFEEKSSFGVIVTCALQFLTFWGPKSIACRGRFWWDPWWFPLFLGRIRRRLQGRSIISESLGPKSSWSWDLLTLVAKDGVFVHVFCKCISFQQGALKMVSVLQFGVFFRTQLTLPYPLKNRGLHVCFCLLRGTSRFVDFVSLRGTAPWYNCYRSEKTHGNFEQKETGKLQPAPLFCFVNSGWFRGFFYVDCVYATFWMC